MNGFNWLGMLTTARGGEGSRSWASWQSTRWVWWRRISHIGARKSARALPFPGWRKSTIRSSDELVLVSRQAERKRGTNASVFLPHNRSVRAVAVSSRSSRAKCAEQ